MEFSLSGSQSQKNELNRQNIKLTNAQYPNGQEKRYSSSSSDFEGEARYLSPPPTALGEYLMLPNILEGEAVNSRDSGIPQHHTNGAKLDQLCDREFT
ncbi:hypothetical protein I79_010248 [Cricetulus griseus]|uniref:Uncharacterized protein n=1 Tax=Cricetulus griseus TaxID=10029 RepID=G3HHY7_CRIGR|nr:hypothetical protein I79_010248 [Cricetulus griseus]